MGEVIRLDLGVRWGLMDDRGGAQPGWFDGVFDGWFDVEPPVESRRTQCSSNHPAIFWVVQSKFVEL